MELGPVNTIGMAATGAHFAQFEKRGATDTGAPGALVRWGGDTGCILATSDEEMGKWVPSLRAAAQIRPYFVVALGSGVATAFGLRLVWPNFRSQRHPSQ